MGSLATASGRVYPGVPPDMEDEKQHRQRMATVLNNILRGKFLPTGTLTLTAGAATTTLADPNIGANSAVLIMPRTANAAGALATTYFDTFADGSCTVRHANTGTTDRAFTYLVIG